MTYFNSVEPDKIYRLFNLGATALVSASHAHNEDIMPASWVCPLDLDPCLVTAVIDSSHYTRTLIEQSGYFALSIASAAIARETLFLGSHSCHDMPDKLQRSQADIFYQDNYPFPLLKGCLAHAIFEVIPEEHNQKRYDLFIGRAIAAWADSRVFSHGHWHFENLSDDFRTLHYVAGGKFYCIGNSIELTPGESHD